MKKNYMFLILLIILATNVFGQDKVKDKKAEKKMSKKELNELLKKNASNPENIKSVAKDAASAIKEAKEILESIEADKKMQDAKSITEQIILLKKYLMEDKITIDQYNEQIKKLSNELNNIKNTVESNESHKDKNPTDTTKVEKSVANEAINQGVLEQFLLFIEIKASQ